MPKLVDMSHLADSPLAIGAVVLAVGLATYVAYNALFHNLANIPGPLQAKLGLGSWLTTRALNYDFASSDDRICAHA